MPTSTALSSSPADPYALGHPRSSPLLRALRPIALAFRFALAYGAPRSTPAAPRTAHLARFR